MRWRTPSTYSERCSQGAAGRGVGQEREGRTEEDREPAACGKKLSALCMWDVHWWKDPAGQACVSRAHRASTFASLTLDRPPFPTLGRPPSP
eukprot:37467-Chlamydomonas_euryale.AAC.3